MADNAETAASLSIAEAEKILRLLDANDRESDVEMNRTWSRIFGYPKNLIDAPSAVRVRDDLQRIAKFAMGSRVDMQSILADPEQRAELLATMSDPGPDGTHIPQHNDGSPS